MLSKLRLLTALVLLALFAQPALAVQSVARQWNEALIAAIRIDLARPPVQARNLFHFSIAAYDSWAAYDNVARPYLLGHHVGGYFCPFNGIAPPADIQAARNMTISYACYRLLRYRYQTSPGAAASLARFDALMTTLGYDRTFTSTDYSTGSPAALGNYIGQCLIDYGLQDGANESGAYAYQHYNPVNPPMIVALPGDTSLVDPNRWQPLTVTVFIDQNGNIIPGSTPKFIGPEWGAVTPFALTPSDRTVYTRGGYEWQVYHDPGPPPYIDPLNASSPGSIQYKWGYELVAVWSSHLKASDPVMWDISPRSLGNNGALPLTFADYPGFYNLTEGGDAGTGRPLNPRTGLPYTPQYVPRGDYTRVLAEFWADGPNSETPPGHWFTILNYVSDQPSLVKRFDGQGPVLDDLQWDVKTYFAMGGAVHDAAITCWGIKGWYDTVRPVSAIRWMAGRGQSSDPGQPRYSPAGIPLLPGYIELVRSGDPLAGIGNINVNKIKLYAWRGPTHITVPASDTAGVGWILAENWWPYQRPTFVTPPFAGFTSGHSTYSRAAAEVMTRVTGDEYFPGGMSTFFAPRNQFLVFEDGPSMDVTLQWATYRDASDQCSLSRIWGGIHPPQDDILGRLIGRRVGIDAVDFAETYFAGLPTATLASLVSLDAETDRIRLTWYAADKPGITATVYRRTLDSDWEAIGEIAVDGSGYLRFEDASVVSGTRYGYRLGLRDGGAVSFAGEAWGTVGGAAFALEGVHPNPLVGAKLTAEFALPSGAPARLELIDIAGRRVAEREVGSFGPGRHSVVLADAARIPPGMYVVRFSQGASVRTARVVVVK
jgi:hypothetical protein